MDKPSGQLFVLSGRVVMFLDVSLALALGLRDVDANARKLDDGLRFFICHCTIIPPFIAGMCWWTNESRLIFNAMRIRQETGRLRVDTSGK